MKINIGIDTRSMGSFMVGGASKPPPAPPLHLYSFENDINDYIGDSHLENLLTGVPAFGTGILGEGLITGTNNAVKYPDTGTFKISDGTKAIPFTISLWAFSEEPTADRQTAIMFNNEANSMFSLGFKVSNALLWTVMYIAGIDFVPVNVPFDTWCHLAATHDGTTARFYVNGVEQKTTTSAMEDSALPAIISIGCNVSGGDQLHGLVDEVRLYDRPLSAAEISDLYHNT